MGRHIETAADHKTGTDSSLTHRPMTRGPLTLALLAVLFLPPALLAGGWPQEQGSGFYRLGLYSIGTDKYYDASGTRFSIPEVTELTTTFYGEYGFTSDLTVLLSVPFLRMQTAEMPLVADPPPGAGEVEGVGFSDLDVGVRYGLARWGQWVLSGAAVLGVPSGRSDDPEGLNTGDGQWKVLLAAEAGVSLYPVPMFMTASAGMRLRSGGYSDEVHASLEAGWKPVDPLLIMLRARGVFPLRNGSLGDDAGMNLFYPNNQQYLAYGPVVSWNFGRVGVDAFFESAALTRNVFSAVAFGGGVYFTL